MSRFAIGAGYDTSPFFRQWWDFHWAFVGNLGVDIPAIFLAKLIGVEAATKLVVIAIPLIAVAGMVALSRTVHGTISPTVPLAAMFAYNYGFNYGFVNFAMSAALCLPALALWIHLGQRGRTGLRAAIFLPLALAIWLAHAVGWGLLGLIVFGYELAARRQAGATAVQTVIGAGLACLVLCAPLVPMAAWYAGSMQDGPTQLNYRPARKIAYALLALRQYNPLVDVGSTLAALGGVAVALWSRHFAADRRLLYPALIVGGVYLVMPDSLLGSGYTDLRLIPYGIVLALLAVAPVRTSRLVAALTAGAVLLFAARTLYVTTTYASLGNNYERELQALSAIPVGSKVYGLQRVSCFWDWHDDRLDHIQRIATVRRQAFTNSTWPPVASQTLSVRPHMIANYTDLDSQRMEPGRCGIAPFQTIDGSVAQLPRSPFDYYWVVGVPPSQWPRRSWLRPLWHSSDAVLYRIDRSRALREAAPAG